MKQTSCLFLKHVTLQMFCSSPSLLLDVSKMFQVPQQLGEFMAETGSSKLFIRFCGVVGKVFVRF